MSLFIVALGSAKDPLSCPRTEFATDQPSPLLPTIFPSGTVTSVKKTSLNPAFRVISTNGLISIPGVSIGINIKLIPECFGACGSVLTKQNIICEYCAVLVQIFCPFMTQLPSLSSPLVCKLAKSEPAFGSEYP